MAKFIGSKLQSDNWGEDYFINKLVEYFDDSFIIYRNRTVFGAEFDVCLLVPKIGIIIFEVKAWKRNTILRVENGDSIVIRTFDKETQKEEETSENPSAQARGYVYKMRQKVRNKTGKFPLVYDMVCFPNLTKDEYEDAGIEPVCEYESTILRDDLENKASFINKMNLGIRNHKGKLVYTSAFTPELMFKTRQIFESNLKWEDVSEPAELVKTKVEQDKKAYSIFAFIPHTSTARERIAAIAQEYAKGTKLFLAVEDINELLEIKNAIDTVIRNKGLTTDQFNLKIDFEGNAKKKEAVLEDEYAVFNCTAYLLPKRNVKCEYFEIRDGQLQTKEQEEFLHFADKESNFNIEQYRIEHSDVTKNVIVRAGAGTGKTFTMISRIAFLCHVQNCSMKEMASRIVMITFTDEAANQMEDRLKQHFNNYYLLTGDVDCLSFINQIEGMQISTIHSYAKKIISGLGFELGYGSNISVTSSEYKLKQIVAKLLDDYVVDAKNAYGNDYIKKLGIPIYQINKYLLTMLNKLHNQSINVAELKSDNFGATLAGSGNGELHNLITSIIPQAEKEHDLLLKEQNKIHLSNMMALFEACLEKEENKNRLGQLQTGVPKFMFVDEFQDTDDIQIEALLQIAGLLHYKLFVVGDIKQCIYRFRGAKENAFKQLKYEEDPSWITYALYKNYRTDKKLLDVFHNTFMKMGQQVIDGEALLVYNSVNDNNTDRLIGTKSFYSEGDDYTRYYRKVSIQNEDRRIAALFEEVHKHIDFIREKDKKEGEHFKGKEREIAILVRENWQAELIKREGKRLGFDVVTNTGGDLYMTEPAIDMLKLANALLHFDEADYLYVLVSSNFIEGKMSKAYMYSIREKEKSKWKKSITMSTSQAKELQTMINRALAASDDIRWRDWNSVVKTLRTMPVLQVLRKLYYILKPWKQYGEDNKTKQNNYKLNVDLLFEELVNAATTDSLSINSLVDILTANIVGQKNVDSRISEVKSDDIIIRCVTVHKAKGLEFGAVILPYCTFPIHSMKRGDMNVSVARKETLEIGYQIKIQNDAGYDVFQNNFFDESMEKNERMREEARILYVAMTRAIRTFSWIAVENNMKKCWQNLLWEE